MRFVLPNGKSIPASYHITEVGHVKKDFIDCGGTTRSVSACVLQAWVAANDEDHRLNAGKLASILQMAGKVLPDGEVPVELEYEAPIISQFTIESSEVVEYTDRLSVSRTSTPTVWPRKAVAWRAGAVQPKRAGVAARKKPYRPARKRAAANHDQA